MLDLHIKETKVSLMMYYCVKPARNRPHKNKANVVCLVFVWTVSGALGNNTCKQNKISAIASLMCKSYKLCHLPAFCVESFNFRTQPINEKETYCKTELQFSDFKILHYSPCKQSLLISESWLSALFLISPQAPIYVYNT